MPAFNRNSEKNDEAADSDTDIYNTLVRTGIKKL